MEGEATPDPVRPDDGERRTRRLALLSVVGLVAAGVALYAWIQTGSPATLAQGAGAPLFATLAPGDQGGPSGGEQAPLFVVETLDGGTFSMADHLADDGRPLFLNLWASWCLPCRKEMPAIDAASHRHPGVRFIGVAVRDNFGRATAFAEEIGVTYTLAFDEEGDVEDAYPVLGLPATFLISPEGLILKRVYGEVDVEKIDGEIATLFGG